MGVCGEAWKATEISTKKMAIKENGRNWEMHCKIRARAKEAHDQPVNASPRASTMVYSKAYHLSEDCKILSAAFSAIM